MSVQNGCGSSISQHHERDGVVHPASLTTPNNLFVHRAVHGHEGCLLVWLWSPCAYALCTKANSLAGCNSNTEYCNTVRGFLSYKESQHLNIEIHRGMVESCDTVAFILARHITMF